MAILIRLNKIMLKNKIKLSELAEKIGITYANLSNLKNGKVTAIRFSTLENICKELNCQPGDILEYLNDDVIDYINSFAKNEIEKEGALSRLYSYASINGEKNINLELAKECFKFKEEITIDKIQEIVAKYYQISKEELIYQSRIEKIVTARHIALYICRTKTKATFKEICEKFNIKEMVQLIYACDKVSEDLIKDDKLLQDLEYIETNLK